MDKKYRIIVEEIDENGNVTRDGGVEEYSGFTILADTVDGVGFRCWRRHSNTFQLASQLASNDELLASAKLASIFRKIAGNEKASSFEDMLLDAIGGGDSDGDI